MSTSETIQEMPAALKAGAVAVADTPVELSATERLFLAHYRRVWTISKAAQRWG